MSNEYSIYMRRLLCGMEWSALQYQLRERYEELHKTYFQFHMALDFFHMVHFLWHHNRAIWITPEIDISGES